MTDDEYKEFLVALARRHLKPTRLTALSDSQAGSPRNLAHSIEWDASVARLLRAVGERSDNSALLKGLAHAIDSAGLIGLLSAMESSGTLAALDEAPEITFPNLRRSVIPDEDVRLLQNTGIEDGEAEITILIHYARTHFGHGGVLPSGIAEQANAELRRAVQRIASLASDNERSVSAPRKNRKLFNGTGKILAGAVTAAGNLLLATGTIVAPNPATAYGVIGSSALAIASMFQGIGDLRGE